MPKLDHKFLQHAKNAKSGQRVKINRGFTPLKRTWSTVLMQIHKYFTGNTIKFRK